MGQEAKESEVSIAGGEEDSKGSLLKDVFELNIFQ